MDLMTTHTKKITTVGKQEKFGPVHAVPTYTVRVRGERGCAMYGSPDLVPEQARCYLSSRPGGTVDVFYAETCACCGGRGVVAKRGRVLFATKPCPRCAGRARVAGTFAAEAAVAEYSRGPVALECDATVGDRVLVDDRGVASDVD